MNIVYGVNMVENLLSIEILNKIRKGSAADFDLSLREVDIFGKNIFYYALLYDNGKLAKDILKYEDNEVKIFDEFNLSLLSSINHYDINNLCIKKITTIIKTDEAIEIGSKKEFFNWYAGLMYFNNMDLASSLLSLYVSNKKCDLNFVYNCFEKNLKLKKFDFNDDLFGVPLDFNNINTSILCLAAKYKEWDIVKKLITENGLDPNVGMDKKDGVICDFDKTIKMPLSLALNEKKFDVVKVLINNGACVNIVPNSTNIIWNSLLSMNCNDVPNDVFELFMESGLDLKKSLNYGDNILSDLVLKGNFTEWFKKIIDHPKCDIDFFERNVLFDSIRKNRIEEFDLLFDKIIKLPHENFLSLFDIYSARIVDAISANSVNPIYFLDKLSPYMTNCTFINNESKYELIDGAVFHKNIVLFSKLLPTISNNCIEDFKPLPLNNTYHAGLMVRMIRDGFQEGIGILKKEMIKRNLSLDLKVKISEHAQQRIVLATQFFISSVSWGNDIVTSFFNAKLNVNQVDDFGNNILFLMSDRNHAPELNNRMERLFNNGVELNHLNMHNQNALFTVGIDVALFYLEKGINIGIIDNNGNNFLQHIFKYNDGTYDKKLNNIIIRDYVSNGKKFNDLLSLSKDILNKELCSEMIKTIGVHDVMGERKIDAISILNKFQLELGINENNKATRFKKV